MESPTTPLSDSSGVLVSPRDCCAEEAQVEMDMEMEAVQQAVATVLLTGDRQKSHTLLRGESFNVLLLRQTEIALSRGKCDDAQSARCDASSESEDLLTPCLRLIRDCCCCCCSDSDDSRTEGKLSALQLLDVGRDPSRSGLRAVLLLFASTSIEDERPVLFHTCDILSILSKFIHFSAFHRFFSTVAFFSREDQCRIFDRLFSILSLPMTSEEVLTQQIAVCEILRVWMSVQLSSRREEEIHLHRDETHETIDNEDDSHVWNEESILRLCQRSNIRCIALAIKRCTLIVGECFHESMQKKEVKEHEQERSSTEVAETSHIDHENDSDDCSPPPPPPEEDINPYKVDVDNALWPLVVQLMSLSTELLGLTSSLGHSKVFESSVCGFFREHEIYSDVLSVLLSTFNTMKDSQAMKKISKKAIYWLFRSCCECVARSVPVSASNRSVLFNSGVCIPLSVSLKTFIREPLLLQSICRAMTSMLSPPHHFFEADEADGEDSSGSGSQEHELKRILPAHSPIHQRDYSSDEMDNLMTGLICQTMVVGGICEPLLVSMITLSHIPSLIMEIVPMMRALVKSSKQAEEQLNGSGLLEGLFIVMERYCRFTELSRKHAPQPMEKEILVATLKQKPQQEQEPSLPQQQQKKKKNQKSPAQTQEKKSLTVCADDNDTEDDVIRRYGTTLPLIQVDDELELAHLEVTVAADVDEARVTDVLRTCLSAAFALCAYSINHEILQQENSAVILLRIMNLFPTEVDVMQHASALLSVAIAVQRQQWHWSPSITSSVARALAHSFVHSKRLLDLNLTPMHRSSHKPKMTSTIFGTVNRRDPLAMQQVIEETFLCPLKHLSDIQNDLQDHTALTIGQTDRFCERLLESMVAVESDVILYCGCAIIGNLCRRDAGWSNVIRFENSGLYDVLATVHEQQSQREGDATDPELIAKAKAAIQGTKHTVQSKSKMQQGWNRWDLLFEIKSLLIAIVVTAWLWSHSPTFDSIRAKLLGL